MNKIDEDIRCGSYSGVYLLYGEEEYLKTYYRKKLTRALIPEADSMNLNVFGEPPVDVPALLEQARTLPFFAEHRLIVVLNSGLFKTGGQKLAEALQDLPRETVLLFSEKDVDSRGKLFKTVKQNGVAMKLDHLKGDALTNWVVRRLAQSGRRIQRSAIELFLERTGDDMNLICNELEKLISYTQGCDAVLLEDVQEITTRQLENRIYEMTDAIAGRRESRALGLLDELLALKESPVGILALLAKQFTRLLAVKDLRTLGLDVQTIADRMGMQVFVARKTIGQSERFSLSELKAAADWIARADEDIKSGRMGDVMALQLAIIRIIKG